MDATDGSEQNEEIEALIHLITDLVDPMIATEYIQLGDDQPIEAEFIDGEIISIVSSDFDEVEEGEDEDEINEQIFEKSPPSRQDARAGLQSALAYFESKSDTFADFMPQIKKLICKIDKQYVKMVKQTSILNYF